MQENNPNGTQTGQRLSTRFWHHRLPHSDYKWLHLLVALQALTAIALVEAQTGSLGLPFKTSFVSDYAMRRSGAIVPPPFMQSDPSQQAELVLLMGEPELELVDTDLARVKQTTQSAEPKDSQLAPSEPKKLAGNQENKGSSPTEQASERSDAGFSLDEALIAASGSESASTSVPKVGAAEAGHPELEDANFLVQTAAPIVRTTEPSTIASESSSSTPGTSSSTTLATSTTSAASISSTPISTTTDSTTTLNNTHSSPTTPAIETTTVSTSKTTQTATTETYESTTFAPSSSSSIDQVVSSAPINDNNSNNTSLDNNTAHSNVRNSSTASADSLPETSSVTTPSQSQAFVSSGAMPETSEEHRCKSTDCPQVSEVGSANLTSESNERKRSESVAAIMIDQSGFTSVKLASILDANLKAEHRNLDDDDVEMDYITSDNDHPSSPAVWPDKTSVETSTPSTSTSASSHGGAMTSTFTTSPTTSSITTPKSTSPLPASSQASTARPTDSTVTSSSSLSRLNATQQPPELAGWAILATGSPIRPFISDSAGESKSIRDAPANNRTGSRSFTTRTPFGSPARHRAFFEEPAGELRRRVRPSAKVAHLDEEEANILSRYPVSSRLVRISASLDSPRTVSSSSTQRPSSSTPVRSSPLLVTKPSRSAERRTTISPPRANTGSPAPLQRSSQPVVTTGPPKPSTTTTTGPNSTASAIASITNLISTTTAASTTNTIPIITSTKLASTQPASTISITRAVTPVEATQASEKMTLVATGSTIRQVQSIRTTVAPQDTSITTGTNKSSLAQLLVGSSSSTKPIVSVSSPVKVRTSNSYAAASRPKPKPSQQNNRKSEEASWLQDQLSRWFDADEGQTPDESRKSKKNTASANLMPGKPGVDYPIHWQVPKTSFDCRDHQLSGFYADVESDCQAYHSCHKGRGGRHTFLCPNGTLFSQELLTCDWWYNVQCSASKLYLTHQEPSLNHLQDDATI